MIRRSFLLCFLLLHPAFVDAQQISPQVLTAAWTYSDARGGGTDEGQVLCLKVNPQGLGWSRLFKRFNGQMCVRNPEEGRRMLGLVADREAVSCARPEAEGIALVTVTQVVILPEDKMFFERLEGTLLAASDVVIRKPFGTNCEE